MEVEELVPVSDCEDQPVEKGEEVTDAPVNEETPSEDKREAAEEVTEPEEAPQEAKPAPTPEELTELRDMVAALALRDAQLADLTQAGEHLMGEVARATELRDTATREHAAEVALLTEEISWLKRENDRLSSLRDGGRDGVSREGGVRGTNPRHLSLTQLRDVMADVYESKRKYDLRVGSGTQRPETMGQHLTTFLHHRYGLRQMIAEWDDAIRAAITEYRSRDSSVALFGAIVDNLVDEPFRHVIEDLQNTMKDMLRAILAHKMGARPGSEAVAARLTSRVAGTVPEDEWVAIVRHLHRPEDATAIIALVNTVAQSYGQAPASPKVRSRVSFKLVEKVLCDYQLEAHTRFLATFRETFNALDADSDGSVTRAEFRGLWKMITGGPDGMEQAVLEADPHHFDVVPLTIAVGIMAGSIVENSLRPT